MEAQTLGLYSLFIGPAGHQTYRALVITCTTAAATTTTTAAM